MSKTLSWVLRHGSQAEGLAMRPDGYVRVDDLLKIPKMREMDFHNLENIVQNDSKSRYDLKCERDESLEPPKEIWWIRANQGHSMKEVKLDLKLMNSVKDIPTGIAVHGTTRKAWELIQKQGLSKMSRNHIHLAQGVPGSGVISMRNSSQILIYVDVQKALEAGIKFFLSANGVVLTEGDEKGFLGPQFFARVETAKGEALPGWETTQAVPRIKEVKKAEAAEKDKPTEVDATVAGSVTDT
ncbi:KptA family-domain-containing protein [Rhodofomes roseus]|uniref:2'-phosphotransferase n=1 Tax=Rhodofomes roseus TaxID=34475 RepID=A0ABQ8KQ86_9APHY|nr:KptA family-domain-containing protein [Rhodofomes roseus]KAH9840037.1 KptA family-domain-containing protein [Rhodofomes roseus]